MAKSRSSNALCLAFSIFVNLLFIFQLLYINGDGQLSWSKRAAKEAEDVAAISCSGHGRAYLDGLVLDGIHNQPVCECNTCYGGPDCSQFITDCAANSNDGDPLFLEPFWMQHASKSAVVVAGWHRMSYTFPDESYISAQLENHIRKLHTIVGNAVTLGRFIVVGSGSTQLLNAAVHALSSDNSSSVPATVVASVPYYNLYKRQTEFFRSRDYTFGGDAALLKNMSDRESSSPMVIEFVTSPNNPDGRMNRAVFEGRPNAKAIHDRVYYWPHFTEISTPADDDIMIFSISKVTGHAGTRFGWAVVKDESVFQRMSTYTIVGNVGVSRDAQLRALKLLNVVLHGDGGKQIFEFGHQTLRKRWQKLSNILSLSNRFALQNFPPAKYCLFFKTIRPPSPAYAWVKCEREEDKDCYAVLKEEGNIYGRRGSAFGAEDEYVRLTLVRSQDDFDVFLHRLNQLVSKETHTYN